MDQRELDALPGRIEELEESKSTLEARIADPGFYRQEQDMINPVLAELTEVAQELETAYTRWGELDS